MNTRIAILTACAACILPGAASAEITIGAIFSITGPAAALGIGPRNAMAMWPTEIGGEPVRIIVMDDASDPAQATRHARKLVEENRVDVLIGSTVTPAALAISEVAIESGTVQLAASPVELAPEKEGWTFRLPQSVALMAEGTLAHMAANGAKTIGFLGYSDAYGESWLREMRREAEARGMTLTVAERFARADTNVTAQALRVAAARPDAVLVVASGSGAAMPQLTLRERGYQGPLYQTFSAVAPELIRLTGKAAEGTLGFSGPAVAPDQLPAGHPSRRPALAFIQAYESRYGAGTYNQFAANIQGGMLVLAQAIPVALREAKPGTPDFRLALKRALQAMPEVPVPQGVLKYSASDYYGYDDRARFALSVQEGAWRAAP